MKFDRTLFTRFSILKGLRNIAEPNVGNKTLDCHKIIFNNSEGKLIYHIDEAIGDYISLVINYNEYNLFIKDNLTYQDYFHNKDCDVLDIVLDDDTLGLSQRMLNNARMSFTLTKGRSANNLATKNADLRLNEFNSQEDTEERSLLMLIQIMCAVFSDADTSDYILSFFIDMSDYFFSGNYKKTGGNDPRLWKTLYEDLKTSFNRIKYYLESLYEVNSVPLAL